eukprot:m.87549 g.87549  ORF g.87549 m.87549 type:complete len:1398 (+) comp9705_c0_seq1:260-4453(+)
MPGTFEPAQWQWEPVLESDTWRDCNIHVQSTLNKLYQQMLEEDGKHTALMHIGDPEGDLYHFNLRDLTQENTRTGHVRRLRMVARTADDTVTPAMTTQAADGPAEEDIQPAWVLEERARERVRVRRIELQYLEEELRDVGGPEASPQVFKELADKRMTILEKLSELTGQPASEFTSFDLQNPADRAILGEPAPAPRPEGRTRLYTISNFFSRRRSSNLLTPMLIDASCVSPDGGDDDDDTTMHDASGGTEPSSPSVMAAGANSTAEDLAALAKAKYDEELFVCKNFDKIEFSSNYDASACMSCSARRPKYACQACGNACCDLCSKDRHPRHPTLRICRHCYIRNLRRPQVKVAPRDKPVAVKVGFMKKRGRRLKSAFAERLFLLDTNGNLFYYHISQASAKKFEEVGLIPLQAVDRYIWAKDAVDGSPEAEVLAGPKEFGLVTSTRTYVLSVDSDEHLTTWRRLLLFAGEMCWECGRKCVPPEDANADEEEPYVVIEELTRMYHVACLKCSTCDTHLVDKVLPEPSTVSTEAVVNAAVVATVDKGNNRNDNDPTASLSSSSSSSAVAPPLTVPDSVGPIAAVAPPPMVPDSVGPIATSLLDACVDVSAEDGDVNSMAAGTAAVPAMHPPSVESASTCGAAPSDPPLLAPPNTTFSPHVTDAAASLTTDPKDDQGVGDMEPTLDTHTPTRADNDDLATSDNGNSMPAPNAHALAHAAATASNTLAEVGADPTPPPHAYSRPVVDSIASWADDVATPNITVETVPVVVSTSTVPMDTGDAVAAVMSSQQAVRAEASSNRNETSLQQQASSTTTLTKAPPLRTLASISHASSFASSAGGWSVGTPTFDVTFRMVAGLDGRKSRGNALLTCRDHAGEDADQTTANLCYHVGLHDYVYRVMMAESTYFVHKQTSLRHLYIEPDFDDGDDDLDKMTSPTDGSVTPGEDDDTRSSPLPRSSRNNVLRKLLIFGMQGVVFCTGDFSPYSENCWLGYSRLAVADIEALTHDSSLTEEIDKVKRVMKETAAMENHKELVFEAVRQAKLRLNALNRPRRYTVNVDLFGGEAADLAGQEFNFYAYEPELFNEIRKVSNISARSVVDAFMSLPSGSLAGGASGAWVRPTHDQKFIIKSLPDEERKTLLELLPRYVEYMRTMPYTLLCRFVGMYEVRHRRHGKLVFVVMENIMGKTGALPIHEMYDLKGSNVARRTMTQKNTIVARGSSNNVTKVVIQKDMDLSRPLTVGDRAKMILNMQITNDISFLNENRLMDYSLLVGIHNCSHTCPDCTSQRRQLEVDVDGKVREAQIHGYGVRGGGPPADPQCPQSVYFFGIIDLLQKWTSLKRIERTLKVGVFGRDSHGISAVNPDEYAVRFQEMLTERLEGGDLPVVEPPEEATLGVRRFDSAI